MKFVLFIANIIKYEERVLTSSYQELRVNNFTEGKVGAKRGRDVEMNKGEERRYLEEDKYISFLSCGGKLIWDPVSARE